MKITEGYSNNSSTGGVIEEYGQRDISLIDENELDK